MSVFGLTDEEKKKILEKHKEATNAHYLKKNETKEGLKAPNKKTP